ncbi:MAG: recombinase family protein [Acidobacteriia bacterium]|nr:recombinase family protein [Terriglobia bacterium]
MRRPNVLQTKECQQAPPTALPCAVLSTKLEPGDTLTVWKLDRLSRNGGISSSWPTGLKEHGVKLTFLSEHLDPDTRLGRAMMRIAGIFAEVERSNIRARIRAGVQDAKRRSIFRCMPSLSPEQIEQAKDLRTRKKDPQTPSS